MVALERKSPRKLWRRLATARTVTFLVIATFVILTGTSVAQTTYASLTSANASAGSANVSKTSISSLFPPNLQAKVYAHVMTWFGNGTHRDVGYSSADSVQVEKQVADMISRGISGAIVNWQGSSDFTNQAALALMAEAEKNSGKFEFAIEEDAAALSQCAKTVGCDLQSKAVSDLTFVLSTYSNATTYMKVGGRSVVFLYGMETYSNVNWTAVENALPGRPILMFRSTASSMSVIAALKSLDCNWELTAMSTKPSSGMKQSRAEEEDHA